MNGNTISKILLVQALEETDPLGRHLPLSTRHHATQQAKDKHGPPSEQSLKSLMAFLATRSEIVWAFVNRAFPAFAPSWQQIHIDVPLTLLAIPTFLAGILINGLGASQRVNLLNFPLLLLVLWNGGIYLSRLLFSLARSSMQTTWVDTVSTWIAKWVGNRRQRTWLFGKLFNPLVADWLQDSTTRFTELLWPHLRPVWSIRLRQGLHLGAACMAVGMILGMYIRGLALDYQATWESTFLSTGQVHGLLHFLLGPAAWILHYPFPLISEISNLQAPQHGPAAPWIHMWALTILGIIVIPRSIMVWMNQRSLNQAKNRFTLPLNDPYFIHLLTPDRGQGVQIDIIPYSYHPSPNAKNFLDLELLNIFGHLASMHWHQPTPFGQEWLNQSEATTAIRTSVVIFNAGQTPEGEVQGTWLHSIQTHIGNHPTEARLLVLLDEEPFRLNHNDSRLAERRQTWQRFLKQYHLSFVPFDGTTASHNQFLQQAQTSLWPAV